MRAARLLPALTVLTALVAACAPAADPGAAAGTWQVVVVATHPHDATAFTEGLERTADRIYESTGLTGRSTIRVSDPAGTELTRAELPAEWFGEGLALAGPALWQLTWRNRVAIERDPVTLAQRRLVYYVGEGWGLCAQPGRLVMSDGSSTLTFRDPVTFARTGSITLDGHRDARLNELDCAPDGSVYANVFPTDRILRIDPDSGAVDADIDAGALRGYLDEHGLSGGIDVLNGIAHVPGTDRFLLTGKLWPLLFEVRFAR